MLWRKAEQRAEAAEALAAELATRLRALHDAIDDFNASSEKDDDPEHTLCWLCGAVSYGGEQGVVHTEQCPIPPTRAALRQYDEAARTDIRKKLSVGLKEE